jgi:hypothetical protein
MPFRVTFHACARCQQQTCHRGTSGLAYSHWSCDACGAGPFPDAVSRMHCGSCSLDVCDRCHSSSSPWRPQAPSCLNSHRASITVERLPTVFCCASGHSTTLTRRNNDWQCDVCQQVLKLGLSAMRCAECDYDCCINCFDLFALLQCPTRDHPLLLTVATGPWFCDMCRKQGPQQSYRCAACDYDMCPSCLPEALQRHRLRLDERARGAAALEAAALTAAAAMESFQQTSQSIDLDTPPWGDGVKRITRILPTDGPEYDECLAAFQPTMPCTLRVLQIERVENSALYRYFSGLKRHIARENNGTPNSTLLMHGTRRKRCAEVALDDHGVDLRFSANGCLYGRAAYFSYNTNYVTSSYAYSSKRFENIHTPPHFVEFLVCEVSLGRIEYRSASDSTIVRPSPGHHSIRGPVTSSGVIASMCYLPHQAYPRFIVTCVDAVA